MVERREYYGYRDLNVYALAYQLALEVHEITKHFPREEKYSLIDQMRRAARSVPANLAEAWVKRRYQKAFVSKLVDCSGEAAEVEVWIDFARDFDYLSPEIHSSLKEKYAQVSRMIHGMISKSEKFVARSNSMQ